MPSSPILTPIIKNKHGIKSKRLSVTFQDQVSNTLIVDAIL